MTQELCRRRLVVNALLSTLFLSTLCAAPAWAESVEFVTYYPAPSATSSGGVRGPDAIIGDSTYQAATPPTNGMLVEGNVLLGTTTPPAYSPRLTVNQSTANQQGIEVQMADYSNALTIVNLTYGNKAWSLYPTGRDLALWDYSGSTQTGGATRVYFQAGGNVGIGTTTPTQGLAYASGTRVLGISGDGSAGANTTGVLALANNRATATVGDNVGQIDFLSAGNTATAANRQVTSINTYLEGAGGANGLGGRLAFFTKADNVAGGFSPGTQRMTITAAGNVGIGTAAPSEKLTVVGNGFIGSSTNYAITQGNSGPVGNLVLNQLASAGQDVGPQIAFGGFSNGVSDNQGFANIKGAKENATARDVAGYLAFATRPSGSGALTEQVRITSGGNVGLGTTTPANRLSVTGSMDLTGNILMANGTAITAASTAGGAPTLIGLDTNNNLIIGSTTLNNLQNIYIRNGTKGTVIDANGHVGIGAVPFANYRLTLPNVADPTGRGIARAWEQYSSRRWKTHVQPIEGALDRVLNLRGVTFDWDAAHGGFHDLGMIAEEVGAQFPEVVSYDANGRDAAGMDYSKMTAVLVEAVKQLKAENEALRRRVEALEQSQNKP